MKKTIAIIGIFYYITGVVFAAAITVSSINMIIPSPDISGINLVIPGVPGINGRPGPIQYIPKGVWNAFANYSTNHQVNYLGNSFVAIKTNTGITPIEGDNWTLLAAKGDNGIIQKKICPPGTVQNRYSSGFGCISTTTLPIHRRYSTSEATKKVQQDVLIAGKLPIDGMAYDSSRLGGQQASAYILKSRMGSYTTGSRGVNSFNGRTGTLMPQVGDYTASSVTYNSSTVAAVLDSLLYVYPSVTLSGGSINEVGSTVSSVSLSWGINKAITSQSINNGIGALSTNTRIYNHTSQSISSNRDYIITVSDGSNTVTNSTTVSFFHKRYWGVSSLVLGSLTSANILALFSEFSSSNIKAGIVYDCTGGKYPTFAYPTSWGLLAGVKVRGLSFSDYSYRTLNFTNASGNTSSYYIYQFNNVQTGSNISVDWGSL